MGKWWYPDGSWIYVESCSRCGEVLHRRHYTGNPRGSWNTWSPADGITPFLDDLTWTGTDGRKWVILCNWCTPAGVPRTARRRQGTGLHNCTSVLQQSSREMDSASTESRILAPSAGVEVELEMTPSRIRGRWRSYARA